MKLRVGIVGLGDAWPIRHRPALRALSDRYDVRAFCSEVNLLAEQAAREFDASVVDGFRALAAREDVDAVLVLGPDWYGMLPVLAACDYGKAVYCASALDIEPQRALEVRTRVEQSGVAFMAEFPRRLAPATIRLKELIATRLGSPQLLFCHARWPNPEKNGRRLPHRCPSETRQFLELVDWCRYVVGAEPASVLGVMHRANDQPTKTDYRMLSLDFSKAGSDHSGPLAQISCGNYLPPSWPEAVAFRTPAELQVCCQRGVAFIDLPSTLVWFDEAGRHVESLESERTVGEQLFRQFHRAVTSLVRKTSDLEDAYRALQIVSSADESCREGRRILLES